MTEWDYYRILSRNKHIHDECYKWNRNYSFSGAGDLIVFFGGEGGGFVLIYHGFFCSVFILLVCCQTTSFVFYCSLEFNTYSNDCSYLYRGIIGSPSPKSFLFWRLNIYHMQLVNHSCILMRGYKHNIYSPISCTFAFE